MLSPEPSNDSYNSPGHDEDPLADKLSWSERVWCVLVFSTRGVMVVEL